MSTAAHNIEKQLQDAVRIAEARKAPLCMVGGNTKGFYGRQASGSLLEVGKHRGVVDYEPTELVITARCGTPLSELETVLTDADQMLAFEPPGFGESATIGGTIACGLSGPRRPYAGAARDFVLGVRIINGKGEILSFGGQVMKNVAGYDVSRLMTGALGTLGLILEVSLKVLPIPTAERTLLHECPPEQALRNCIEWTNKGLPISATCYQGSQLHTRISGAEEALNDVQQVMGGEIIDTAKPFWKTLKEQQQDFFTGEGALWRLSVPAATPIMAIEGEWLLEWGGALRWLRTDAPADELHRLAAEVGGHACLFRGGDRNMEVFHPLDNGLAALHQRLKASFDPAGILNPGRMYQHL